MRRALLVLLVLGLLGGGAFYLWPRARTGGALEIVPNPIDFGEVPWLEVAKRTIEIRNVSNHEVLLKDPHFNCSCFSLTRPPDTLHLAPGRSTSVEVLLYTPKTTPGRFHKTFTLVSDDPVSPQLDVPVSGTIVDYRSVTPKELTFGAVDSQAEPSVKVVEVRGGHSYGVVVASGRCSDPRVTVEITPATGGSNVTLRTVRGAAKGQLDAQVSLTLEVSGPDGGKRKYPEIVWVHGEFR